MTNSSSATGFRVTPHLVIGLLIILLGVLFTLDNLDVLEADEFVRYWPAGVIAIGLAKLWQLRSGDGSALGGIILVAAGAWLQLETLGYVRYSIVDFWPLLLVIIGGMLVAQGLGRRKASAVIQAGDERINATAIMAGINRGSNSTSFRGGELTAFMGGCEIDLRQAAIHGEAVIDVFAMWGGIEIRVPENWTVLGRVTPLLAGFDDQTRPPQDATAHRLIVRGLVIMGGIEVKN